MNNNINLNNFFIDYVKAKGFQRNKYGNYTLTIGEQVEIRVEFIPEIATLGIFKDDFTNQTFIPIYNGVVIKNIDDFDFFFTRSVDLDYYFHSQFLLRDDQKTQ